MYLRCLGKIFLNHLNILHYYKLHSQKCKKSICILNYHGPYSQMPVTDLENLAQLLLSENSNFELLYQKVSLFLLHLHLFILNHLLCC